MADEENLISLSNYKVDGTPAIPQEADIPNTVIVGGMEQIKPDDRPILEDGFNNLIKNFGTDPSGRQDAVLITDEDRSKVFAKTAPDFNSLTSRKGFEETMIAAEKELSDLAEQRRLELIEKALGEEVVESVTELEQQLNAFGLRLDNILQQKGNFKLPEFLDTHRLPGIHDPSEDKVAEKINARNDLLSKDLPASSIVRSRIGLELQEAYYRNGALEYARSSGITADGIPLADRIQRDREAIALAGGASGNVEELSGRFVTLKDGPGGSEREVNVIEADEILQRVASWESLSSPALIKEVGTNKE